ncbi:MAG: PP2C family protein-serine/threonine phosphatase [Candidatus Brocadiia bacterium]
MARRTLRFLWAVAALAVGFNALWLLRPPRPGAAWWVAVGTVNAAFVGLLVAHVVGLRRLRRRASALDRSLQRLELRVGDQELEARVLETINEVSASFLNKVQLRTLLRQMSEALYRILAVDATVIELLPQPEILDTTTFASGATSIEVAPEVRARVIEEGKSVLVNDLRHYPRYAALAEQGLRAMIAAPFKRGERVTGLIGAFTASERAFTSRDLSVLFSFATHTSLLLESAALLDAVSRLSLRRSSEQVESLHHLRSQLSFERELSDREFAIARRIQSELLPQAFPQAAHSFFDGVMLPAREVGGDFFDVIPLGEGRWGLAVADVAGKGVPAALVMVMAHTLLRAAAREAPSPRDVLLRLNQALFDQTTRDCFVSMFYGVWEDGTRTLRYANAGHEPPLRVRDHHSELLPRGGVALGAFGQVESFLAQQTLRLDPAEALVFYTDGVREAMNAEHQMYGLERMAAAAERALAGREPLVSSLRADLRHFVAEAEQHDDITLLALQAR